MDDIAAEQRKLLVEAVRASAAALRLATGLMSELEIDYQSVNHERWAIAYRWVIAAKDLVWHCRKLLDEFDNDQKPIL